MLDHQGAVCAAPFGLLSMSCVGVVHSNDHGTPHTPHATPHAPRATPHPATRATRRSQHCAPTLEYSTQTAHCGAVKPNRRPVFLTQHPQTVHNTPPPSREYSTPHIPYTVLRYTQTVVPGVAAVVICTCLNSISSSSMGVCLAQPSAAPVPLPLDLTNKR